jgi:hypothetical protein
MAELVQQEPEPRRPPDVGGAVADDASPAVHAEAAHRGGKFFGRLAHEAQALRCVGDIAQHIDELRAWDVALFEVVATRLDLISDLRIGDQVGRAVEDQHIGIIQVLRQPLRLHQIFGVHEFGHIVLSLDTIFSAAVRADSSGGVVISLTGFHR